MTFLASEAINIVSMTKHENKTVEMSVSCTDEDISNKISCNICFLLVFSYLSDPKGKQHFVFAFLKFCF